MQIKGQSMRNQSSTKNAHAELGLDLNAGDEHYRAYVGPPEDYDLVSALTFNLLTNIGLRQHHRTLDVGCGSLRVGRLLIPYLNPSNYYGIEPNKWLVDDGIMNETGEDLIAIKKPTFSYHASLKEFNKPLDIDYAIAQSIFSHCGIDLIRDWLSQIAFHLKDSGVLIATFLPDNMDYPGSGWVYPACTSYKPQTIHEIASEFDLDFIILDWAHPRQTWALFCKKDYNKTLVEGGLISRNRSIEKSNKSK